MAKRPQPTHQAIEPRVWQSAEEIDRAIAKLNRRIEELDRIDVARDKANQTSECDNAISNFKETIRDVFGSNSPEFHEHQHARMWAGPIYMGMSDREILEAQEAGRKQNIGYLKGLINRLEEKKEDFGSSAPSSQDFIRYLNLHPRISDVAGDLFEDGYHWEAVFAASKALVNFVKERSGQHHLDGAQLMRTVFSKNDPILRFNEQADQTDLDEQEGMMHLFEGVVLGIRNPGGHSFPEGPEQRAVEYLSLISLLAFRTQEAKRKRV